MSKKAMGRRTLYLVAGSVILLALFVAAFALNRAATGWMENSGFHAMLEKETAKGLHLNTALYAPIKRVGVFGMQTDWGAGQKGQKTLVALEANQVTGAFNPLGIFLRRWQIQYLHFATGSVWLQKTEAKPEQPRTPGRPWYLFFWPDRVYLNDIKVDKANILFQLQNKESGIHGTFLEITPNGRDFEYDARGGTFTTPETPQLNVEHIHLLVRKPRLYCPTLILGDDPAHPDHQLRVTGEAGLQQDRGIKVKADIDSLNVSPWLPATMRSHMFGTMNGHFDYVSTGTGLETAKAQGDLAVTNGVLHDWKAIDLYIAATKSPNPGDVPLKICKAHIRMEQGAIIAENIEIESEGIFRVTGTVRTEKDKTLSGQLEIGLTAPYLKWLPTAQTAIFTRAEDSYHFTTVHLYGSSTKPQQDLTPRLLKEIGDHPFVAVRLFFNSSSEWLHFE